MANCILPGDFPGEVLPEPLELLVGSLLGLFRKHTYRQRLGPDQLMAVNKYLMQSLGHVVARIQSHKEFSLDLLTSFHFLSKVQIYSPADFKVIENFSIIRDFASDPNIEGRVFEILSPYKKRNISLLVDIVIDQTNN